MLIRFMKRSFLNQKKAMALMVVSVAVGTALAASLISISLDIKGKISTELRAFGANIIVEPKVEGMADISGQKRFLRQEDIIKVKTIFWRHNILGVAPFLESNAELLHNGNKESVKLIGAWYEKMLSMPAGKNDSFPAGIRAVAPWWVIEGKWPSADEVLMGLTLSSRHDISVNDRVNIDGRYFTVSGIIETGGIEDKQAFMELESLQDFKEMNGKVSRVLVSALTTPMDEFAYKDPATMTPREYDKWYCTGYVTSIANQVAEVFSGSVARPIWQVAETEGRVLDRIELLIYLLSVITLVASALSVSTTMIMSLLRRTEEIGLMKSIGAGSSRIISIFISEGIIIGLAGGIIGYLIAIAASHYVGIKVFDTELVRRGILFPLAIGSAVVIAILGTILPIRRALSIKPAIVLKGAE
jgi:putative ABC transport system permease protein